MSNLACFGAYVVTEQDEDEQEDADEDEDGEEFVAEVDTSANARCV